MNKEFVPHEQALKLKELGFDESCFGIYVDKKLIIEDDWLFSTNKDTFIESNNFTAPLYQQVFRWFREKYGLVFWIEPSFKNQYQTDGYVYYVKNNGSYSIDYATYEQAEIECLKKLIEIVKS